MTPKEYAIIGLVVLVVLVAFHKVVAPMLDKATAQKAA